MPSRRKRSSRSQRSQSNSRDRTEEKLSRLKEVIRKAKSNLSEADREERFFFAGAKSGPSRLSNDSASMHRENNSQRRGCVTKLDRLVERMNSQLAAVERRYPILEYNLSSNDRCGYPKSSSSGESTTRAENSETSLAEDYDPLNEMEFDVQQLEHQITNIEEEVKDDISADSIGIPIDPADLIDYFTGLKVLSSKRHFLKLKLYKVVLDNKEFAEEASIMKKLFAIWNNDERSEVLRKLARLEATLGRFGETSIILNEEFNKDYPVESDIALLRKNLTRFLDRFEYPSSSSTRTGKLLASSPAPFLALSPEEKQSNVGADVDVAPSPLRPNDVENLKTAVEKRSIDKFKH